MASSKFSSEDEVLCYPFSRKIPGHCFLGCRKGDFGRPYATCRIINSDLYIQTLREVRPHKNIAEILLQHDSVLLHANLKTHEAIKNIGLAVRSHPPYSPNLAPSDLRLFAALKKAIRGKGLGLMTRLLKKRINVCEYKIQTRRGWQTFVFLSVARLFYYEYVRINM